MKIVAIIVAGGLGRRLGNPTPKQFLPLRGRPLLMHTLEAFAVNTRIDQIRLVLPAAHRPLWSQLCSTYGFDISHQVISGGEERFFSVRNALEDLGPDDLVAIHDGVRPLVTTELIERALRCGNEHGAAVPVLSPADSLRQISGADSHPVNREMFRTVQTPQVFRASILTEAYRQPYQQAFTDDATVVEQAGFGIRLFDGDRFNLKVTTPEDLQLAEALLMVKNATLRPEADCRSRSQDLPPAPSSP